MLKAVAFAFFPVPVCVALLAAGLALLVFTRRRILGTNLIAVGVGLLGLFSSPLFADWAISRLERQYPPLAVTGAAAPPARYVVVLAGKLKTGDGLPPTSRLGAAMLMRLTEGIRLHRVIEGSKLVLSGGNRQGETEAAAMAELAVLLGVAKADIITETQSLTTHEQAQQVKAIVGAGPVVLVTSASHMPRAMRLFRDAGMTAIAAPTAHNAGDRDYGVALIPSSRALDATSEAVYEALAFVKAKVLGRL